MDLLDITNALASALEGLRFGPPITHVYNPLIYARQPYEDYARRFGQPGCKVVLLGMNPGPWGMAQTGIPFGDAVLARAWLGIEAPVGKPAAEHPKRPVLGFACPRREISGMRLWGWARERFGTPERFFARFFIINYCPLCFMEDSGRNFTPDKLPARERAALAKVCDRALRRTVEYLRPRCVIGVGRFAELRAHAALDGMSVGIGRIPHPSPASPAANRGWAEAAEAALAFHGIQV